MATDKATNASESTDARPATGTTASPVIKRGLPPGPSLPVPLQTLGWVTRPLPFLERCRQRYGDTFTLRIRNEATWVVLSDPEDVKRVFTGDPNVLRAGEANAILGPVVGSSSLLLLDEPKHMDERKLMLPPFHGERMQGYRELIVEATRRELASWPEGQPFQLWPRMQAITLEAIMRAVFGIDEVARLAHVRTVLQDALEWLTDRRQLAAIALLGPDRLAANARFKARLRPVDEALLAEIARRRNEPDLERRQDILSLLILARYEDGSQMSDAALRDELVTLLVAGHETTATSLAWAFERLLRHPDKLERLRDEVRAGEQDAYLDAVVKETLRLRPVLPIVVRRLAAPMVVGGYEIPAGIALTPCIHLVHRRADVYPQPHRFMPERFLESPAGTYTWIPFGGGVRRCLGASFAQFEMKQVLGTILSEVDLRAAEPRSESVVRRSITLTPDRGATAILTRRSRGTEKTTGKRAALDAAAGAAPGRSAPSAKRAASSQTASSSSASSRIAASSSKAPAEAGRRRSPATRKNPPTRKTAASASAPERSSTRAKPAPAESAPAAEPGASGAAPPKRGAAESGASGAAPPKRGAAESGASGAAPPKRGAAEPGASGAAPPKRGAAEPGASGAAPRKRADADGEPTVRRTRPSQRRKRATPEEEQAALEALHGAGVA
jgi:cytochrome P450